MMITIGLGLAGRDPLLLGLGVLHLAPLGRRSRRGIVEPQPAARTARPFPHLTTALFALLVGEDLLRGPPEGRNLSTSRHGLVANLGADHVGIVR
ncbi:hypothetical protein ACHAXT_008481 [Thalassiosira profunda]